MSIQNPAVARNITRVNDSGLPPQSIVSKVALTIKNVVKAGQSLNLAVSGDYFYFTVASGVISVRPSGGSYTGVFNEYQSGTGLEPGLVNAFTQLELKNDTALDIIFVLFVGFAQFIDRRLVIAQTSYTQVAFPTYPVEGAADTVLIPDLSGNEFLDINGNKWFAISRIAILVFNPDPATILRVVAFGEIDGVLGNAVACAYPTTTLRLECSGDYQIGAAGGVNVNGLVSEIYNSIAKPN